MSGGSNITAIPYVIEAVKRNFTGGTIVDIGAGKGKYGVLLHEYIPNIQALDGVDPDEVLAKEAYSTIYQESVQTFLKREYEYDLALLIAVLCNFSHAEGKSIIRHTRQLCTRVILTIEKEQHGGKTQWRPEHIDYREIVSLPYEWLIIL